MQERSNILGGRCDGEGIQIWIRVLKTKTRGKWDGCSVR